MRWIAPMLCPRVGVAATLLGAIALAGPAVAASDAFEADVRHLRRSVQPQRDGSHLPRLFALRQLHEPELAPLFRDLLASDEWQMQVHGVLGLAEISPTGRIDPALLSSMDERSQEAIVTSAIDMDMIGPDEIRTLLSDKSLPALAHLVLFGEFMLAGEPVDRAAIARLADTPGPRTSALASLFLAQLGEPSAISTFADRVAALPRPQRRSEVGWLLEAIRQYELTAALPWVESQIDPENDRDTNYWAVYTVLALDAERGMPYWRDAIGVTPGYREQVRYGMQLLAAGPKIPVDAYDLLSDDSLLVQRMAVLGRALSTGQDPSVAFGDLIELGHSRTVSWAMDALEDIDPSRSAIVYARLIDGLSDDSKVNRAERITLAVTATSRLFEIDPAAVLARLDAAEDDGLTQEALVLGLFEAKSPAVGAAAARIRRIGVSRADALALLLLARHADTLTDADRKQLGRIASGGAQITVGLQVQAAWLHLKHTNAVDRAFADVLGTPASGGDS